MALLEGQPPYPRGVVLDERGNTLSGSVSTLLLAIFFGQERQRATARSPSPSERLMPPVRSG